LSNNLNVMDDQIPALMADYLNDWMKKNGLWHRMRIAPVLVILIKPRV
jgi:hypothetical protein